MNEPQLFALKRIFKFKIVNPIEYENLEIILTYSKF